jgi:hypothetical protein
MADEELLRLPMSLTGGEDPGGLRVSSLPPGDRCLLRRRASVLLQLGNPGESLPRFQQGADSWRGVSRRLDELLGYLPTYVSTVRGRFEWCCRAWCPGRYRMAKRDFGLPICTEGQETISSDVPRTTKDPPRSGECAGETSTL